MINILISWLFTNIDIDTYPYHIYTLHNFDVFTAVGTPYVYTV